VTVGVCGQYWSFTPGFWKNHTAGSSSGHDAWQYTAYTTNQLLGSIFNPATLTDKPRGSQLTFAQTSLLAALSFKGGPGVSGAKEVLLRAGVAALLNASFNEEMGTPPGSYPLTVDEVIAAVNEALASENAQTILNLAATLDGYNNGNHYIDWSWSPGQFLP
jgi:hypothetical protein